jgi:hypothetical protein
VNFLRQDIDFIDIRIDIIFKMGLIMDLSSHLLTDSSSPKDFTSAPGPVEGSECTAVKQAAVLDHERQNLGLAPHLVEALAKDRKLLSQASIPPKDTAGILVKWLKYFYREGVNLNTDPSLYALNNTVIHATDLPGPIEDLEEYNWFFTNVQFIKECVRKNSQFKDNSSGLYKICLFNEIEIIDAIFRDIPKERIKEGLKPHLGELLSAIIKASEKQLREQDILKLLTDLAELSDTIYQDKNYIFRELKDLFSRFSLVLVQGFADYLSNKDSYPELPLDSFLFLLQRVYCKQDSALAGFLPSILAKMEEQQKYFEDEPFAVAYAKVYGKFLSLYFACDSDYNKPYCESDQKRLLHFMFLSPPFPGSDSAFTLQQLAQVIDFEAVKLLSTPREQGEALGLFLNCFYAFRCFITYNTIAIQKEKIEFVFKAYFKETYRVSCNEFSFIFDGLWSQLDAYIKDLAKNKGPTDLLQHVLPLIKGFTATLKKEIWEQSFWQSTSVSNCSDLILKILESHIIAFSKDSLAEGPTKAKLLANLIEFLSKYEDKLELSGPLDWLEKLLTVQKLWSIASTYLEQPESYEVHEHSIYLGLLKYLYLKLDREASVALVKRLEDKKDFFENSVCHQDYHALYQDSLIRYFFHKMTHSQVYFCDYEKDRERLQKVASSVYATFIKRVLMKEKLVYVDNPLNGDDLEVTTLPPLLKDLNCKVITNNEGYFDVDESFIDKLSLSPSIGNVLKLSATDETPIGYTAYLPQDPKAIWVCVYGGKKKKDKKNAAQSSIPGLLDRGLLHQKVAVIYLNLPDLLESSGHQCIMPSKLYTKIHACIHRFHTVLSTHPESLHQDLGSLQGLPIGLYGASFGGALIFNQSLLYPNSFTRYISHSGVLDASRQYHQKGDLNKRFPVAKKAKDLQDTYLILHTANDPCVNVQCSLGFYKKAAAESKRVKLSIITKGGRGVGANSSSLFAHTGHFFPVLKKSFAFYIQEIVHFLTQAQPLTPLTEAISQWRAHTYESYMEKYMYAKDGQHTNQSRSLEKMILSQMYLIYKNACVFKGKDTVLAEPSAILDAKRVEAIWDQHYFSQYKAYKAAEFLLENNSKLNTFLKRGDSDVLLVKATERFLANHWIHFEEILNMKLGRQDVDLSSIAKDLAGVFQQAFKELNNQGNWCELPFSTQCLELLAILLTDHPQLIEESIPKDDLEDIAKQSPRLKEELLETIRQSKRRGARVMREGLLSLHTEGRLESLVQDYKKGLGKG